MSNFDFINEPIIFTFGDLLTVSFLIILILVSLLMLIFVLKDRFDYLESYFVLNNAAFNNHLRDYHGVNLNSCDSSKTGTSLLELPEKR